MMLDWCFRKETPGPGKLMVGSEFVNLFHGILVAYVIDNKRRKNIYSKLVLLAKKLSIPA